MKQSAAAALVFGLFLCIAPQPAFAWDDFGHMEVAAIAWRKLDAPVRARVTALLQRNPMYKTWIIDATRRQRDQIAFVVAATWPDQIKSAPDYTSDGTNDGNRPPSDPQAAQNIGYADHFRHKYWHFIDMPFSPDNTPLQQPTAPNAQTQIAGFRAALADPAVSDDIKSYDLAWLLHLVGDVHQPLHATSRFLYPTKPNDDGGDAGGNSVKIDCGPLCEENNLHWFWDDAGGIGDVKGAIVAAGDLAPADPQLAAVADEKIWINESFELAKAHVYQPPVGAGLGPFTLTDDYKAAAADLADQRIALAGARLANLLNAALK
jgi:hypothetical protein